MLLMITSCLKSLFLHTSAVSSIHYYKKIKCLLNQTFYVRHIQATNNISLLFLLVIINKKYLNVCIAFRKRYFNKL